ncbi:MAG: 50S ribosomal protein L5 [Dehalococcoidia bacterium]|nr:50S ribosomal protein L5 [Dehalococcoidia bacterium]
MEGYAPRLREKYRQEIIPALIKEFGYKNPMEVPRAVKVVVNIGLGEVKDNPKVLEAAERDLVAITGQKPVTTRAKKSIANFKLRQGMAIGMMVTLRGARMYEFLDRLASIAMPRIRDFRGIPINGFDGRGNYSLGLREQVMFPEVDFNQIDKIRGLQITVVTTARNDEQARRLLTLLGFAFEKSPNAQAA